MWQIGLLFEKYLGKISLCNMVDDLEQNYHRWFDDKQDPTSGRGKKEGRLKNQVYEHGELLLCRWLHKQ